MDFDALSNSIAQQSAASASLGAILSPPPLPASIGYKSLQKIQLSLAGNTQQTVQISGNFIYVLAITGNSTSTPVTLQPIGNAAVPIYNNTTVLRWDSDFTQLIVNNPAASTLTLTLIVGYGDYKDYSALTFTAPQNFNVVGALGSRPANVIPYAANQYVADLVGGYISLTNISRPNGTGINFDRLCLSKNSTTTANADFTVLFFSGDQSTGSVTDQTPYVAGSIIPRAVVRFPSFVTGGAGSTYSYCDLNDVNIYCQTGALYQTLFAYIVANAAYVPTASEVFTLTTSGVQY